MKKTKTKPTKKKAKLKPCPWCGSKPEFEHFDPLGDGNIWYRVYCLTDDHSAETEATSMEGSIKAWNTRKT